MINKINFIGLFLLFLLFSCGYEKMSFGKPDPAKGMNGGFEIEKSGLPVNWAFYGFQAYKSNWHSISFDKKQYKEGTQSLHFNIDTVDQSHFIWRKPGLLQTYWAKPEHKYKTGFSYMNTGCHFRVKIGSEKSHGAYEEIIIETHTSSDDWESIEYEYTVPEEFETIRLEINIFSPGDLWIDDIIIESETDQQPRKIWGVWLGI